MRRFSVNMLGVLGLFWIAVSEANAQEVTLLTVDKCLESALKLNASVQISKLKADQAQYREAGSAGAMFPTLSSSLYEAVSTDQPVTAINVKATQPLFLGGELIARKHKMEAQHGIASTATELTRVDVAYTVKRTFYEIKKAEAEVKLLEEELIHAKRVREANEKLVGENYQTQSALLERIAQVAQIEKALVEKEQSLSYLTQYLQQITGLDSHSSYVLEDIREVQPTDFSSGDVPENTPFFHSLDLHIAEAEQDLKIAKSSYWPKAYLVSQYRREKDSFYEKNALEAGVLVKFNIWDFGITSNEINTKHAELEEQKLVKESGIQMYKLEFQKAVEVLSAELKAVLISKQAVAAAEEEFKNMKVKHMQGDISDLAMHEAEIQMLRAKTEVTKASCDYWIGKAEVIRLIGGPKSVMKDE